MHGPSLICHMCGHRPEDPAATNCPADGRFLVLEEDHLADPRDPFLGTLLDDKYPVLARIGGGGMGTIYLGRQTLSERPLVQREVAIKVARIPTGTAGHEARRRFLLEARAIAALGHPGIVTLYDYGTAADGSLYMVLERVHGRELAQALSNGGLTSRDLVAIALGVLEALQAAHDRSLVHRDIKPQNIMILEGGRRSAGGPTIKLLDFGIAKALEGTLAGPLTAKGMVPGTPRYMSPEQASGKELDGRSDLYSLGVLLYEALSGQALFEAEDPVALAFARCTDMPRPLSRGPGISTELAGIVTKALAHGVEQRFSSAAELADALADLDLAAWADTLLPLPPGGASEVETESWDVETKRVGASGESLESADLAETVVLPRVAAPGPSDEPDDDGEEETLAVPALRLPPGRGGGSLPPSIGDAETEALPQASGLPGPSEGQPAALPGAPASASTVDDAEVVSAMASIRGGRLWLGVAVASAAALAAVLVWLLR